MYTETIFIQFHGFIYIFHSMLNLKIENTIEEFKHTNKIQYVFY